MNFHLFNIFKPGERITCISTVNPKHSKVSFCSLFVCDFLVDGVGYIFPNNNNIICNSRSLINIKEILCTSLVNNKLAQQLSSNRNMHKSLARRKGRIIAYQLKSGIYCIGYLISANKKEIELIHVDKYAVVSKLPLRVPMSHIAILWIKSSYITAYEKFVGKKVKNMLSQLRRKDINEMVASKYIRLR